ncbi:MAG: DDE-type integrase/transposase/recombinase [Gammaproteobacteria bacterium]|nr:DDE-type integrase/transposase/recombinase [Gammaproteobacteria bacterium]
MDNSLMTWHTRFGHLGFDNLKLLQQKNMVLGLSLNMAEKAQFCDGCALGKQTNEPFPKGQATRAKELLGIIHSDVCGPMQVSSMGGAVYFLSFIDDKSRYVHVDFLKNKSEVFQKFCEFEARVTTLTGQKIKVLRTDNGGEYTSKQFADFCAIKGITHQCTVPYTPQQNGVAERFNRTVEECARSMLQHAGLSMQFWAEAASTAVYLRNRCPTVAVEGMTPYEAWVGQKPGIKHLRVFGCRAFAYTPRVLRKKWDPVSKRSIFLGYGSRTKGFRLWDLEKKVVFYSRSVSFDETRLGLDDTTSAQPDKSKSWVLVDFDDDSNSETQQVQENQEASESEGDQGSESESSQNLTSPNDESSDSSDQNMPRRSAREKKVPEKLPGVVTGQ